MHFLMYSETLGSAIASSVVEILIYKFFWKSAFASAVRFRLGMPDLGSTSTLKVMRAAMNLCYSPIIIIFEQA